MHDVNTMPLGLSPLHRPTRLIVEDWESSPLNTREHYRKSPVAKFSTQRGDFSPERYMTRTFNRKMKMRDTFTNIFPGYNHQPQTCFTKAASHIFHPKYEKSLEDKPIYALDKRNNHKVDEIKNYSEEMYKLGCFAPQPIKGK